MDLADEQIARGTRRYEGLRATYTPRPIMPTPEAMRWRLRKRGLDLSLRSRGAARRTTSRSAVVFRMTEMAPRRTNWKKTWPRSGAMNCGMKEGRTTQFWDSALR